jgi:hypothetical protein
MTAQPNINRAKAIAAMGLVGRDYAGFNVISPGFAKETYRVWKDDARRIHCSCSEFNEQVKSDAAFRCEHIWAVKFHLESAQRDASDPPVMPTPEPQNTTAPPFPSEPIAKSMADLVTPKQLVCIRVIASDKGINPTAVCREWLHCKPEELSRKAASAFIDRLKTGNLDEPQEHKEPYLTFVAYSKYAGRCKECGDTWEQGEAMYWNPRTKEVFCQNCGDELNQ